MGKYSYFYFEFCINYIVFYLLICLLIFNINVSIYLLFSQLWRRAPVGCCMAGSTGGVAMSPWYGENQTATPPSSYTTYATTSSCKYYTTKSTEFYTTTYAAVSHYTDALKYYSAPSYYTI
jgi:hypothetical protein